MRLADIIGCETDSDSPVFRLRDVNRLKKMRARGRFIARRHLDFVAIMYAPENDDDEEMFSKAPPPRLEPKFSMPDPIMAPKFDDEPMGHLDDITDLGKDEIDDIAPEANS